MLLSCSIVRAVSSPEGIQVYNPSPAPMWWDEHGGTYVVKVAGLEVGAAGDLEAEPAIRLEADLTAAVTLMAEIAGFASEHRLALPPLSPLPVELTETPILAAFHVPGKNLFIYCEDPTLRIRAAGPQAIEMVVTGGFQVRRVPCREGDVVIHLTATAMGRLLAYSAALLQKL
jgi:hypothetical protein